MTIPRGSLLTRVALFLIVTAIFAFGWANYLRVQPSSDIDAHISLADRFRAVHDIDSPHFLFPILLKVLHPVTGTYEASAIWLLGLCYGGMAVLIARDIDRRGASLTMAQTLLVVPAGLLASHIFLFTLFVPNMYFGYFVPISYHNATQQLLKLLAVGVYFLYCAEFLERNAPRPTRVALISLLCVLSALAKPSFLIAFLPAGLLFAARDLTRREWRKSLLFGLAIVLPSALVLLAQARFAYGAGAHAQIIFAPFVLFDFGETLWKLPLSLGFPLVVWMAAARAHVTDRRLMFMGALTTIGLMITLLIGEGGPRLMEGNFAWTGQTVVFLAYIECLMFLVSRPLPPPWRRAAWGVFALHVASGVIWYAAVFSPERTTAL